MAEAPRVAQLRDDLADHGVIVVGVTSESREDAREFIEVAGGRYPVLANAAADRDAWGVDFVWGSVYYLLDPNGVIVLEGLDAAEDRLRTEFNAPRGIIWQR